MKKFTVFIMFIYFITFTGCGTPSNFYHLYPTVPYKEGSFKMGRKVIGVAEIKLADYINKEEIVTKKDGSLVDIHEKDNWAGDFGKNIQLVITQNLNRVLRKRFSFIALPSEEVLNDKYRLFISIERFDSDENMIVTLQGHWSLKNLESNRRIKAKMFNYSSASSIELKDVVNTKSILLERLSREIASEIRKI